MRTREILATVAVTGAVATFALLNMNGVQTGNTFLATQITDAEREFINFIAQHQRSYGTKEEYEYRLSLFAKVYEDVKNHDAAKEGYTKEINHFADFSDYEWKRMMGYNAATRQADSESTYAYFSEVGVPASVDWRSSGAVTPVKNQGSCGSCWSFSTTGAIEGAYKIAHGTLYSLSEQQFVDCDKSYGDLGCNGGLPENAFKYAKANKVEQESAYPYTGKRDTCVYSSGKGVVQLKGQGAVTKNSPSQLQAAVARQPVSVGIEADKAVFQSYKSGIITSTACGTSMDHAVLVVGYGSEGGQDYWLLKNSWGTTWGEKGYFRLGRSSASGPGICGLQQDATYPTV